MQQTAANRNGFIVVLILLFSLFMFNGLPLAKELTEIARLEQGLLSPTLIDGEKPWPLTQRMMFHKVPGVSIAVIKDFKVHWARGYGYKDVTSRQPVTATTLFQAASISKPVAASAALHWVEKGKLKLDANVNDFLRTWKLPDNDLTKKTPVTLKMLLSHSGGLTVHGFRGYSAADKVPALIQVLNGTAPANSAPIRVDLAPGTKFRYSGGGFTIMQMMLIDTVKQTFPIIMEDTVLKPFGMTHSTYLQPLPPDRAEHAASGHQASGMVIPGKWHTYPEMAAAGMWTTPRDLAKFAIHIQLGLKGSSNKVLSQKMIQEMLTPYNSPRMGLGLGLSTHGDAPYFQHAGGNQGFRCFLLAHKEKGYGAAIMTNGDNGHLLHSEIIRGIAYIYDWEGYLQEPYEPVSLALEKLIPLAGVYAIDSDHMMVVKLDKGQLFIRGTGNPQTRLFPIAGNKFVRKDSTSLYSFETTGPEGKVSHMVLTRNGRTRKYTRKPGDYMVPLELLHAGRVDDAMAGYREMFKTNPKDRNIDGMRLLYVVEHFLTRGKIRESMGLLHLTAELYPGLIKKMANTLNNEMRLLMRNPMMPDAMKKQVKDSYNAMLKKLGLKEIE